LYDDGETNPAAVTRDYVLKLDAGTDGAQPPVLSIYGGKLTTYRKLAEAAVRELRPHFPSMRSEWTAREALAGGDLPGRDRTAYIAGLARRHSSLPEPLLSDLVKRHGTLAESILGDARTPADLGRPFAEHLTEREVDYMRSNEWARSADDVLWRRTKCGLGATTHQRNALRDYLGA
jgi:glycerol-3-phosphate dehydrogenase